MMNNKANEQALLATPSYVVAFAASAGGLAALSFVVADLPRKFPAAIVIVQHVDPKRKSLMADILGRRTALHVEEAAENGRLAQGTVFVAPPDKHLLVNSDGALILTHTELVHFVRPSADLLFESVAASFRKRAIAVVLTGTGLDGSMGVLAIKKMGGKVIVQDLSSAEFGGMPTAAIQSGAVDLVLPLNKIAPALIRLVGMES